jgi:hypothetical protein
MYLNIDVTCPHCENEFEDDIYFCISSGNDNVYQSKEFECDDCGCKFKSRFVVSVETEQVKDDIISIPEKAEGDFDDYRTLESRDPNQLKLL